MALVPSKAPILSNIHVPKNPKPVPLSPLLSPSCQPAPISISLPATHNIPVCIQEPCQSAVALLERLHKKLDQVPASEPEATDAHSLAVFTVPPESCVSGEPESDQEDALNGLFHQAFGWEGDISIDSLIQHKRFGVSLCRASSFEA